MPLRRLVIAAIVSVALLACMGFLVLRVTRVPDAIDLRAPTAKTALSRDGLECATSSDGKPFGPLSAERVSAQSPKPGSLAWRDSTVYLELRAPERTVVVPDLVARYADDAAALATTVGLRPVGLENEWPLPPTRQEWGEYLPDGRMKLAYEPSNWRVVISQEPTVGASVPYGSEVRVVAVAPHGDGSVISPGIRGIHGLFWMRYGTDTATRCNPCHAPQGCTREGCHEDGETYGTLSDWASRAGFR